MISCLEFNSFQQQQGISNIFTPNIQITNTINNNKNQFKQNKQSEQQNQQNNQQLQQTGIQLTYRALPRSNSDSEVYEKSSQNYLSHFSSMVNIPQSASSSNNSQQQQISCIQFAKQKQIKDKDDVSSLLSPTSISSAQTQSLNKKFQKLTKKQNSMSSSSSSTHISSCQSLNNIQTTKISRPFPEHEFFICADNLSKSSLSHIEDEDNFLLYPVIQANSLTKNIQYVEYNKKKAILSVHLQNKLSNVSLDSQSPNSFEEVLSTPHIYDSQELNNAINSLQKDLNTLTKVAQPYNHSLLESETYKMMGSKTKASLLVAYRMNEKGTFETKGIHMNEKFLIYTKWDTENYMMTTLNSSIQEMFTAKNYENFMTNTFKSMSCAFNQRKSSALTFNGELRMSDNGVREVEMTVESSYSTKNGFLFVSYIIDKVISERKAIQQKKKSNKSSLSSTSSSTKQEKSISGGIRSQSNSIVKRKASNSFTFEETTICNDDESLSQHEKSFLQRYYSL